jgi:hypothetical protein
MSTSLTTTRSLQLILGVDKKNPVFTIYRDDNQHVLHIYYGLQLLETVPDNREHVAYKMLVGRLYNAGVNRKALCLAFKADPKTMRKWGEGLKSEDPADLVRALAGRQYGRKFTSDIQAYVTFRFPQIYGENHYDYSKQLRLEIEEIFKTTISGETMRPLLKGLKEEMAAGIEEAAIEKRETSCDDVAQETLELRNNAEMKHRTQGEPLSLEESNRKGSPWCEDEAEEAGEKKYSFCHHAGLLIFSGQLLRLGERCPDRGWLLKQWLSVILLGAKNIEQTKLLDFYDLQIFLGDTRRLLHEQRQELRRLSTVEMIEELYRFNAEEVGAAGCTDFYYDPHTKHYTGMRKVLKGWCPSIRFADKALHMDFIHTCDGHPVYSEPTDNYEDLRERFGQVLERFCRLINKSEETVTIIVDRGIYGHQSFESVIEDPSRHIITWEKGYKSKGWDEKEVCGRFIMERRRNNAQDIQQYLFEYMDEEWGKNASMRLLRVLATNPKGKRIEVGVLTDDKERAAREVIELIFRRWLQENDFKYLEEHFGINEITSYLVIPYRQFEGHMTEKQMKTGQYKALEVTRQEIKKKLKDELLKEHQKKRNSAEREEKIGHLAERLAQIEEQLKTTQKEMSRLEFLIQQDFVRLDTQSKQLMDAIKIIARNAFYKMLQPFKEMYNNYRDDHVLFRNLTRSDGLIRQRGGTMEVILLPTPHYPPKIRAIMKSTLEALNAQDLKMPDGSARRVELILGEKNGFKLAIVSP